MNNLRRVLSRKDILTIVLLMLILLTLPVALYLVQRSQVFIPRAAFKQIELGEGPCVKVKGGEKVLVCDEVPLKLNNPFAATSSAKPKASVIIPSTKPSPSAVASAAASLAPLSVATPSGSATPSASVAFE